jgi:exopolysaccharide biosynthesis protein
VKLIKLFLAFVISLILSASVFSQGKNVSNENALRTCQNAIRQTARDPETAVIPDVGAMRGGVDWRYLWNGNSRMVRLKNGLGLEVAVIAMCVVDEKSGNIKLLVIDGKQLITPGG